MCISFIEGTNGRALLINRGMEQTFPYSGTATTGLFEEGESREGSKLLRGGRCKITARLGAVRGIRYRTEGN